VRFVTSTQRDLEAMVRRGQFRKDLYYRLNGARIHLPSLSERKDDIADLVEHHWRALTGSTSRFPTAALDALRSHDWPGNVRELVSVLRRLSLDTAGAPGTTDVRAALGQREARGLFPPSLFESHSFDEVTRKLEKSYLEHLFEKHAGNLEDIAAVLKTTTRSIYRRFERLGLKPRDLKSPR
jgi:DNA-binding NtrC family response regulator